MTVTPSVSSSKGRVLIVGATGFIGQFIAESSLDACRPTYVLVRPGPYSPSRAKIIKAFQDKGAIIIHVSFIYVSVKSLMVHICSMRGTEVQIHYPFLIGAHKSQVYIHQQQKFQGNSLSLTLFPSNHYMTSK